MMMICPSAIRLATGPTDSGSATAKAVSAMTADVASTDSAAPVRCASQSASTEGTAPMSVAWTAVTAPRRAVPRVASVTMMTVTT